MALSIDLAGQIAIVTGGAQGIGKCITEKLLKAGATVVANDVNQDTLDATVEEFSSIGTIKGIVADISTTAGAEALISQTVSEFGKIDILVNNAGIVRDNLMLRMKEEDFDLVIKVNLKGTFLMCKAVYKQLMKQKSGSIINISSLIGLRGNPGQANYAASKAGIIGLTKTIAKELAKRGVRANAVAPGYIKTAMTDDLNQYAMDQLIALIPGGRLGYAEDVANAVLFLASPLASYITGETISVDGGMNI